MEDGIDDGIIKFRIINTLCWVLEDRIIIKEMLKEREIICK